MKKIFVFLKKIWNEEYGYKQVLRISLPLILTSSSWTIQQFVDRIFLSWYSTDAIAATLPSGILNFTLLSIFIGSSSYVGTFISQYNGAGELSKIGKSLWHGIYLAVLGGIIMFVISIFTDQIIALMGHPKELLNDEKNYFNILSKFGIFPILSSTLSSFYTGRGKTWQVLWVNFAATIVNIVLDYIFIFGKFGLPEMGVYGAGLATGLSGAACCILFLILIFCYKKNKKYHINKSFSFDAKFFFRLLKFGMPSGVHFFLDVFAFSIFIILVGKIGTIEMAATNIAFNINTIAFMPMIGIGIAVSTLVGENIGKNNIKMAERSVKRSYQIAFTYMGTVAVFYFLFPQIFILPYKIGSMSDKFREIENIASILLKFVAVYCLFDSLNIIFASSLKGAGDTKFVMLMGLVLSFSLLIIPSFFAVVIFKAGIYTAWIIVTLYIILLGIAFLLRYLTGKWKNMKVIEHVPMLVKDNIPGEPML